MKYLTAIPLAFALIFCATTSGTAQTNVNCGSRSVVIDNLYDRFGETRQSVGLGANNAMVEVFASDNTGTWTITVTSPGGKTCLVASGQSFEKLAGETPVQADDA